VVIVGFGAAGLTAAITAHDAGAEVIVLEKMPEAQAGGNFRVSGQVWFSPHDAERAKTYLCELAGEFPIPKAIVEAWAHETAGHTAWLRERAGEVRGTVPRDEDDPYEGDGTDFTTISYGDELRKLGWRDCTEYEFYELDGNDCGVEFNYIGPSEGFSRLWLTLRTCFNQRGIPVLYETRATELRQDASGAVVGVRATSAEGETVTLSARRGVILACGGFANNQEMVRNYLRLPFATPWGSPGNTGDGILMAQKVGADLAHPGNYMAVPGLRMPPYASGDNGQPRGNQMITVGGDGRRFMDETIENRHGKIRMRGMFDFFPGFPMWTIFDEDARLAGPIIAPRSLYAAGWMKQVEHYEWSADNSAEIERGWIARANSMRELAAELDIDPDGLEREVAEYQRVCEQGHDPRFGRRVESLEPLARPPFYGYRWGQLLITTLGGIRKDERARALDPDGQPIAGLYCAGDVASTYTWCLSGGLGLGDAMAFARLAVRDILSLNAREPRQPLTA
jgi:succinate dehydrogenase/fumarate reductase flavoprotein subunit